MFLLLLGCSTNRPQVIVITSTPDNQQSELTSTDISPITVPTAIQLISPTSTVITDGETVNQHTVQAGDTLSQIAGTYNVSLQAVIDLNQISNPNLLEVGQILILPSPPTTFTPSLPIISDSRLVRSPLQQTFEVDTFIANQSGFINGSTDTVETRLSDGSVRNDLLSSDDVIKRVATEYSVDERLLLAFLEYRAKWLTQANIPDELVNFPLVSEEASAGFDRSGLYKQLSWLANELNRGYYGRKYRDVDVISFADGTQFLYNTSLNPASIAIQYVLGLNNTVDNWQVDISESGFVQTYSNLFGSPTDSASHINNTLQQPILTLPFRNDDVWRFTGGFHGGWGSGSAWAALDFAPPDDRQDGDPFCYISEYPITAVSSGMIARNSNGALVLDLDGDGNERTGWSILYLHMTVDPAISTGQTVEAGTEIGSASCFGGFSSATHLHIARRYNGEWIPADCNTCDNAPPFVMSSWEAVGLIGQEYQGYMVNQETGQQVIAEQGRNTKINEISW